LNYNPSGIYLFSGGNCQIYHNTINLNGATLSSTYLSYSACISIAASVVNIDVRDNILKNSMMPSSGTGNKTYSIYNGGPASAFSNLNYNNHYVNGINPNIGYQGGNQVTFTDWQTATAQDANSVNLDPIFASATDLHPTNATMSHLGIYLPQVPTDYSGNNRTNPPDMGAYEYSLDPLVTTVPATSVLTNGATLNGSTNPNGFGVTTFFDYGTTTAYGSTISGSPSSASGSSVTSFNGAISSLLAGTTYHFRAKVLTAGGVAAYGNDYTFTTLIPPPTVVTTPATSITTSGATLNGTINANGTSTAATFEYGLTPAYGLTITAAQSPVTGNTVTLVNAVLAGLQPNTLYHYRAVGVNSGGTVNGSDMIFTTNALPPTVVTDPATNIQPNSAQLNGTVSANNALTSVSFEYGVTTAYGNSTPASPATVNGAIPSPVMANVGSLIANTTYHFRCVGINAGGTTYGADMSFLTGCPIPANAGTISGISNICRGSNGYTYTVPVIANASDYNWTVPAGATIVSGANSNSIVVNYSLTAASGNISVYGSSVCGSGAPSYVAITANPSPVPTITGPASACLNSTGNVYTTESGMTGYIWSVSTGGTITSGGTSNAITVAWSTTGAKTVVVNYTNSNGCSAITSTTYPVSVNPLPVPTITGNNTACMNTNNTYTTQTGMTGYIWTVSSGGTITAGAGTNVITVLWNSTGAKTVSVNYINTNGCSAAAPAIFNITVNPVPVPTIGSSNNPCVGSSGNMYYTEASMTGYVWTVSAGGTIVSGQGTNAINITWNGVGAQSVNVNYNNSFGCPATWPAVYNLFVNPLPASSGPVTGTAAVCAGTNGVAYSCSEILNATSYTWTLPAGAVIATGAGTRNITVNFTATAVSGIITSAGTNNCGNGTVSPPFAVTVNPLPAAAGTITGSASVCSGASGVNYSVATIAGATSYIWTIPAGAAITSGATTSHIVVTFGSAPSSGVITVKGNNTCGSGTASPNFNVTVNAIPATPVVSASGNVLTSSSPTGNQWYYDNTGAIPGATAQNYTVINNTGWYWCTVTTNGCVSPISNKVYVVVTGIAELPAEASFSIYPVPNNGRFTVSINYPANEKFAIQVFNQVGSKIYELNDVQVNGMFEKKIDLSPLANGVYSVIFITNKISVVRKLIVAH
jgi:hypothetical protein